jgi:AAA ATPase domain
VKSNVAQTAEARGLGTRRVRYQYRYCPRCRLEWPAGLTSCPECVHWLGDRPLERTEWQLVPESGGSSAADTYDLIDAGALVLRVICNAPPTKQQLGDIAAPIDESIALPGAMASAIVGHGWLIWTPDGLRRAFSRGQEVERRLLELLPVLEGMLSGGARVRWGIWIDQYVLPFDRQGRLAVPEVTARAIFNFEPDNICFSSEPIYQINRRWEHFVCAPRRLLDGQETHGYRLIAHKRPSALDHAEASQLTPFVGRKRELAIIEDCWTRADRTRRLAIIAEAGSGKTRLIREWLRTHPALHAASANFSLFGGGVESFASQLAELPTDQLDCDRLVDAVSARIRQDEIHVLVLDDFHWADESGRAFVRQLIKALSNTETLIILASRPSGEAFVATLQPTVSLRLKPLATSAAASLARRLIASKPVAAAAARRSRGSPLFVEQFAAWAAETNFTGGNGGPRNLHQVIAARIEHLSNIRMADLRQRLRWGHSWERRFVHDELGRLEAEIGLWLDRLETGDYADRVEAARHLDKLERLNYEIFITSMLAGRPRPRSSRLREAIERLLTGSVEHILADLKRRADRSDAAQANVFQEAMRAGDVLLAVFNWSLAQEFYELAASIAPPWQAQDVSYLMIQCRDHARASITNDAEIYAMPARHALATSPNVHALVLPYVWIELGRIHRCSKYFERAAEAAVNINDHALAAWAERKAQELDKGTGG